MPRGDQECDPRTEPGNKAEEEANQQRKPGKGRKKRHLIYAKNEIGHTVQEPYFIDVGIFAARKTTR